MCVLVLLYQVVHGHWLVIGANRDEQLGRPSGPPALTLGPSEAEVDDASSRARSLEAATFDAATHTRRDGAAGTRPEGRVRTRPTDGPRTLSEGEDSSQRRTPVAFVAPRDLSAGGTWMGLNRQGLFVALTNRSDTAAAPGAPASGALGAAAPGGALTERASAAPLDAVRSRGLLVRDLLQMSDLAELRAALPLEVARARYQPFHLVAASAAGALMAVYRAPQAPLEIAPLGKGVHVIGNRDGAAATDARTHWIRRALVDPGLAGGHPEDGPAAAWCGRLRTVLGAHPFGESAHGLGDSALGESGALSASGGRARDNPCLHSETYGTRSSAVLALAGDAPGEGRWRWWHAEGPPCAATYEDYTGLLDALQRATDEDRGNVQ